MRRLCFYIVILLFHLSILAVSVVHPWLGSWSSLWVLLPIVLLLCILLLVFHHPHVLFCWPGSLFPGLCRVPRMPDSPMFLFPVPLLWLAPGSPVGVFPSGSAILAAPLPHSVSGMFYLRFHVGFIIYEAFTRPSPPIFRAFLAIPGILYHPSS